LQHTSITNTKTAIQSFIKNLNSGEVEAQFLHHENMLFWPRSSRSYPQLAFSSN